MSDGDEEEPTWLTRFIVERVHAEQIREHGGDSEIRDESLLEAALARPRNTYAYDDDADLFDLASEYAFGLTRNHPFVDGNKRTSFLAAYVFLSLNGWELVADEREVVSIVTALSSGDIEAEAFARWLREKSNEIG